ncbi:hypothetical protein R1sor_019915 [Riccia sorocarpa]|uniref:Uncharacterized protein n=1 Tax=Riccia sorocarpa TaxID=122646 RepID=A0ABD3IDV3_9MARC
MGREDVAYVDAGGPAFLLNRSVSPASSCSSSSSNSEMKPRAMARSVGAQKNAARHRMTKRDYEMIVTYLENPDNFAAINGCGRKTKITGKTLTKVTAFGHMAVTLCAQGFVNLAMQGCRPNWFLMFQVYAKTHRLRSSFLKQNRSMLSGDEEEAADREEEPIDLSDDDEVDYQTAPVADGDDFFETARPDVTSGAAFYQTAYAQSRGDASVQSVEDVRSSGKTVRSRDRPPPPERKTSLITAYEEQVKEKPVLRKEAQDQKASFRDAILEDRRQAREQRERARIREGIESMRSARADRRSTLLVEMVKTGKSMDEIHQAFLLLDSVEERLSGSM